MSAAAAIAPAPAPAAIGGAMSSSGQTSAFKDKIKPTEVRQSNIVAAKAVADAVRTSLGPRGMDKMIKTSKGEIVITNDGATLLKHMNVLHPAARMLVELSAAQDVEAGDGTTSVVVIAGSLLAAAEKLLAQGIHPTTIAESFLEAGRLGVQCMQNMSVPVDLADVESLRRAATTSLSSKILSQYSAQLAPLAVDAVMRIRDPKAYNVDLRDIRIIKKVGGTIDDTELHEGLVLTQHIAKAANGPSHMDRARVALIQFQLSAPKPDLDNQVIVNDYRQMDKILREERAYLLDLCKKIKKSGANVLLVQKSILRDSVSELALHFLALLKILVIRDIERTDVEHVCKALGCKPIADIESMTENRLGYAESVSEVDAHGSRYVRFVGCGHPTSNTNAPSSTTTPAASAPAASAAVAASEASEASSGDASRRARTQSGSGATGASSSKVASSRTRTVSIVVRGANDLVLKEAERSLHDALCVIRCLVKRRALIAGGGAPEVQVAHALSQHAHELTGQRAHCVRAFAEALEIIPVTLAENAGLNPIAIVTELRRRHAAGEVAVGVNVRKGAVTNMIEEHVVQPLLVNASALELATETVCMILKIDDIVSAR